MASYILRDIDRELFERAKIKAKQQIPNRSLKAVIESLIAAWLEKGELEMAIAKIDKGATAIHRAEITVTENLSPRMYLRQELASGSADDGTPIEVSQTGPSVIIHLGKWPNGRQFVVNLATMSTDILEQLTRPSAADGQS